MKRPVTNAWLKSTLWLTVQKHFCFSVIGMEIFKIFCLFLDCYFLAFDSVTKFRKFRTIWKYAVYSIKHQTRCTINLIFIVLSRRHRSTCLGHCCAHQQEPPPAVFAASGYRMIAGLDVFQAVVGLLVRLQCVLAYATHSTLKPVPTLPR
jgi:hypothetical protein